MVHVTLSNVIPFDKLIVNFQNHAIKLVHDTITYSVLWEVYNLFIVFKPV